MYCTEPTFTFTMTHSITGLLNSDYDPATGLKKSWLTEYDIVNPFNYTVDEVSELHSLTILLYRCVKFTLIHWSS